MQLFLFGSNKILGLIDFFFQILEVFIDKKSPEKIPGAIKNLRGFF
jgi:hypothetical protein